MVENETNGFVPELLRHIYLTHLLSAALSVRHAVLEFLTLVFPVSNWDPQEKLETQLVWRCLTVFCEEKDSHATGRAYEATCAMLSHECGGKLHGEWIPRLLNPTQVPEIVFWIMMLGFCEHLHSWHYHVWYGSQLCCNILQSSMHHSATTYLKIKYKVTRNDKMHEAHWNCRTPANLQRLQRHDAGRTCAEWRYLMLRGTRDGVSAKIAMSVSRWKLFKQTRVWQHLKTTYTILHLGQSFHCLTLST